MENPYGDGHAAERIAEVIASVPLTEELSDEANSCQAIIKMMDELLALSATRQASLIQARKISSRELIQAHLRQVAQVNPHINAVVELLADQALMQAGQADDALARGESFGPFHGVPFSVKDSLELEGTVCTAGTLGRRGAAPCPLKMRF